VVGGLHIIHPHPIEQDERLAVIGAADRKIGLDPVGSTLLEVERGIEAQEIDDGVEHQAVFTRREHANCAVDLFEGKRLERAGHNHGFGLGLLGQTGREHQEEQ
jgi:hypothetical protein